MSKITKGVLTNIILKYYISELSKTQSKLAEKIGVDHSSISNWLNIRKNVEVSNKNFKKILAFVEQDLSIETEKALLNYTFNELITLGFDQSICKTILNKSTNFISFLKNLITDYEITEPQLQHHLNIHAVISKLRSLFRPYEDYIKINAQKIFEEATLTSFSSWLSCSKDPHDPGLVTKQNYLILNFPNSYRVCIVLSNYVINDVLKFGESVQHLKEYNNIHLIIFFTDNEVSHNFQKYLLESYNLFFESITKQDLMQTSLQNINYNDIALSQQSVEALFYAQAVFERFTAYFAVIRNEIIFRTYSTDRLNPLLETLIDKNDLLKGFAEKILLKEIFKYSYLSRHAIYFERKCLSTIVKEYQSDFNKELGTVVEICYPNSFLSSSIYEHCEKLFLFTSSYHSVKVMKDLNEKNGQKIFPLNIHICLSHIQPQYISSQYYNDIVGKVDLVILGFGMGSSIVNITEFMRHINSWLAPGGMVFISFANSDSVILHKQFNIQNYLETTPIFFSDYWKYTSKDNIKFLSRIKRYNLEEAKKITSTYADITNCYTYPFLSSLSDISREENWLLDEVREIDKKYALEGRSRHGHYIIVIGHKNLQNLKMPLSDSLEFRIKELILSFLKKHNIEFYSISHPVAIDTKNLFRILINEGEDVNQFDLLKTVLLQKRDGSIIYVITSREQNITYNNKLKLLSEKNVTNSYGMGSISPLVMIPEITKFTNMPSKCFFYGPESLTKEFVIMSSGISTESLKIRRSIFIDLLKSIGVKSLPKNTMIQ